ncbi:S-adenosylmethionine-dependent tRNA (m5U54) methyltransferase [Aureococcus anophagefferens]|nr:S-adenosylmethionine-dependent tRNA (m5U54) methyltransferase [Aureococcus anophagefferens]
MGSTPSKKYAEPDRALAASPPSQLERNPSASAPDGGGASPDKGGVSRPGRGSGRGMRATITQMRAAPTQLYGRLSTLRKDRSSVKRLRSLVVSSRSLVRYEDAFEDAGGIILGEGRQVVVRQAIRREDRAVVAVRRLTTRDVSLAELHRQLSIFELVSKQCVHRNIVKIEGLSFSDDDESLHVMFKIYRGGELLDAIVRSDAPWSEEDARGLAKRLLEALRCCHASGIAHRQVRAENVLLKAENDFAGIALGGWSLARPRTPADEASVDVVGASLDLQYTAPEVLAACGDGGAPPPGAFATAQGVWALGVLLRASRATRRWTRSASTRTPCARPSRPTSSTTARPGPRTFKRAKTKLKFVVSMIIQANRAKKLTQAIMEGVKKEEAEAAGDAAPAADAAPTTGAAAPIADAAPDDDVEDTLIL